MLNPPVFMKTHGKQKFRREPLSSNTLNGPVKGTVRRELWNQRGNTGWPGFIPTTWTPWHFWQLDTKVNTMTPTGPFWAASSQQLWRAHTGTATTGQEIQSAQSYFAGLREDAMSSWQSCTQHTYRAPVLREGWPQCAPEVCPARAVLERHSRGCASCQTERQRPCPSWQSSWGHKSLSDACSVQTWAPDTHFRRCWGLINAPTMGPRLEPKPRALTFTWELLHLRSKLNTLLQSMSGASLVVFVLRRDEPLSKYWFLFLSLSKAQYIARIFISCCLCRRESKGEKT